MKNKNIIVWKKTFVSMKVDAGTCLQMFYIGDILFTQSSTVFLINLYHI